MRQPSSVDAKPKAKSRAVAKAKIVLQNIAEAETVAEPVVEPVAEPVKMKTRKPVNKQPKPASEDAPHVAVPDLEYLVMKRMKAMRDAKELKKKEQIQALIAQAIKIFLPYVYKISNGKSQQEQACKAHQGDAA